MILNVLFLLFTWLSTGRGKGPKWSVETHGEASNIRTVRGYWRELETAGDGWRGLVLSKNKSLLELPKIT